MKFSSLIKVDNKVVITTNITESSDTIEKSLNCFIPVIVNGIYLFNECKEVLPNLNKGIWIESENIQIKRLVNNLENDNSTKIVSSRVFSNEFLNDHALSNYEILIINNFHYKDPYADLILSNWKYIQIQRKSANLPKLKIVLFSYLLPIDCLVNIFDSARIFNMLFKFNGESLNIDTEISAENYLENVLSAIYLLFKNKIDDLDSSVVNNGCKKVLVFLANAADVNTAYKWLNNKCNILSNPCLTIIDNNISKKNINSSSSLIALTSSTDKSALNLLNIIFDYVIDGGFISSMKLDRISKVNILSTEKIDITESLIRSHYVGNPIGKIIQLYPTDKKLLLPIDLSNHIKIKHDVTDFLFCQIALGEKSWSTFSSKFFYFPLLLKCGIENLLKAKIIEKKNQSLIPDNVNRSKVIGAIINYQLTELGSECLKLRILDCQSACVLLNSIKNECFISALTTVCCLQLSDLLFVDLYDSSDNHLKKLKIFYDGNDDLIFLLKSYRHFISLSKDDRLSFAKSLSLNKNCFNEINKNRSYIKSNILLQYNATSKSDLLVQSFVSAYPSQIARYSPIDKLYMKIGYTKSNLLLDPYSFAYNEDNLPEYVFYYSSYTLDGNTYMKYVSPICKEIWDMYSDSIVQ